ncbi:MAG: PAS domain S-box protein [Methanoregula sp.]|nr:PAS domain S-box protein [Methanoregula sp.]
MMDITAVLVFFCLASAIVTYGLGLVVYSKNPGSAVNRLFLLAMLAASYWAAGEYLIWQSTGYDAVRFWLKASAFWTIAIMLTLHFVLAFTGHPLARKENLKFLLAFIYLPAVLVSLAEIFTESIYTVIEEPGLGNIYIPVTGSPAYIAESLLFVLVMAVALYVCLSSWLREGPGRVRQQNLLISIGMVIVILSGAMSAFALPLSGIHLPNTVFIGIVCFSGIISYAMIRQGLFTLSPESAAANIIRTMPDGLILADNNCRIITANTSAEILFRKNRDELVGRPIEAILPRQGKEAIQAAIRERGMLSDLEIVLETPEYRVVSITGSLITDPDGKSAGIVLIIHDITGRKASERALRLANEKVSLLGQLTRHDITNLVNGLHGYMLLLQEKVADPASAQYIAACTGIIEKIERHLQFSREYEEIGEHEPVWQSAGMMVDRAKSDLAPTRVEIVSLVPQVQIYTDPIFVKVVYNLLENALRHGGAGLTRVQVSAEEHEGGELVLLFEDDGVGIPAEEKERIFRHGVGKHTGLGLTLSRDILAVTGIRITETGIPGKGARFEIHIPSRSWKRA